MENLIKSEAIVLRGQDLGESHLIVTLLTVDQGKFKAVARGAKRSKKRFQNALEPFTHGQAIVRPSRTDSMAGLEAMAPKETFSQIRRDILKFTLASLACELLDLWLRENSPEARAFTLLLWFLHSLEQTKEPFLFTLLFKTRLLSIVGYGPDWGRIEANKLRVSQGTIKSLAFIQETPLDRIDRLRLSKRYMREAWTLIKSLHIKYLEKEPRSYNVLRQMAQGGIVVH